MKEKLIKIRSRWLIAILLALIAAPSVFAVDYSENGINYALNEADKTAEVTGGTAVDLIIPEKVTYEGNDYVVKSIKAEAFQGRYDCKSLVLPNSLTTIGNNAFSECKGLTGSLTLPNSLTTIGEYAFLECKGFTGTLILPESLTSIEDGVFANCSGFSGSLTIPNSVTSIGNSAFFNCYGFTGSLTIPESVTIIGSAAFRACVKFSNINCYATVPPTVLDVDAFDDYSIPLRVPSESLEAYKTAEVWKNFQTINTTLVTKIDYSENGINYVLNEADKTAEVTGGTAVDLIIPEKVTYEGNDYVVTSIGAKAFKGREDCKSLVLPASLTTIGERAFSNCIGLTGSLDIPDSVTYIGDYAFFCCAGFNGSLTLSSSLTTIGEWAFAYCYGFTGSLIMPDSVTSIGDSTFQSCTGFTGSLTLSNSLTSIGNCAFYSCSGFTGSLTIPNSVTSIGESAFDNCKCFIGSLNISESATYIGSNAFNQCSGFYNINCYATVPPTVADKNAFSNYSIPLSVPSESLEAYKAADVWKNFQTIDTTFVSVKGYSENGINYVLNAEDKTAEVTGGTAIDIIIPEKVTFEGNDYIVRSIGKKAFMNRYDCKSLVLPISLTAIKNAAFYECFNLTGTLTIPESVTLIDDYAFTNCSGLTGSLIIPDSVTYIGYGAFYRCTGFTGPLNLPNSLTAIGDYAFCECQGFDSLTLSDSLTTIGNYAFYYCLSFTGPLNLPNSLTAIGNNAFNTCIGFTGQLTLPNLLTDIGDYAFYGCQGFDSLVLSDSLVTIGDGAFWGCRFTGSLIIPESVISIGSSAFRFCNYYTGSLTLSNSLTSIGSYAFGNCSGFTGTLSIPNSVTSIEHGAFNGCSGFDKVNCYASVPPTVADTTAFSNYNIPLNVPLESLDDYKTAEVWKEFSTIKPIGGVLVESVTLDCDKADVKVGESIQLLATVLPEDADDKSVVWTSSNEAVATVDANGMVTGVAEGNATVTATAPNGVCASCEITVIPAMGIADQKLLNWITPKAGGVSINIDATSDTRVDIANMAGMVVESFVVPAGTFVSTDYDAESLAPGFYVVSATSAEIRITKRIVIR